MKKQLLTLLMALLPMLAFADNMAITETKASAYGTTTVEPRIRIPWTASGLPAFKSGDDAVLKLNSVSVGLWFNPVAAGASNYDGCLMRVGTPDNAYINGLWAVHMSSDGELRLSTFNDNLDGAAVLGQSNSLCTPSFNAWHHILLVIDNAQKVVNFYLDGEKTFTKETTGTIYYKWGDGQFIFSEIGISGAIDEIQLFNGALTDEEAAQAYADASKVEKCNALYTFDEIKEGTTSQFANMLGRGTEEAAVYETIQGSSVYTETYNGVRSQIFAGLRSQVEAAPELIAGRVSQAVPQTYTFTVNITGEGTVAVRGPEAREYASGEEIEAETDLSVFFTPAEGWHLAKAIITNADDDTVDPYDAVEFEMLEDDGSFWVGMIENNYVLDVTFEQDAIVTPDPNAEFTAFDFHRYVNEGINVEGCYGLTRYDLGISDATGYTKKETLEGANGVTMKLLADETYTEKGFRLNNSGLYMTKAQTAGAIPAYCYIVLTAPEGKHFTKITFENENASTAYRAFGKNCALRTNTGEINTTTGVWTGANAEVAFNCTSTAQGLIEIVKVTLADGEGEAPKANEYTITIEQPENGTVAVMNGETAIESGDKVEENSVLSFVATPADGYQLGSIIVNSANWDGETITVTRDLTISATFTEIPPEVLPNRAIYVPVRTDGTSNSAPRLEVAETVIFDRTTADKNSDQWPLYKKDLTMMAWYKLDGYTNCTYNIGNMLMGHQAGPHVNYNGSFVLKANSDGSLSIIAKNNCMNNGHIDANIELGKWFNLALTWNSATHTFKVFVDGAELYTITEPTSELALFPDDPSVFTFGACGAGAWVDEAAMFDVALTADQIETAMVQPAKLNPVAYYTFDQETSEGNGTFANLGSSDVPAIYGNRTGSASSDGGIISSTRLNAAPATFADGREIVIPEDYCFPEGKSTQEARYTSGATFTGSNGATFTISNVQAGPLDDLYKDCTDQVVVFAPGETVTFTADYHGEWMHQYVYVDFNKNGVFTASLDGDVPAADSELLGYNFYKTRTGEETGFNNRGQVVESAQYAFREPIVFTLPTNIKEGNYRLRFTSAWNSIDPCSYSQMYEHGACYADITLRISNVAPRMVTVGVNDATLGKAEIIDPATEGNSVNTAQNVTIKATPTDADAYFVNWTDADGNVVSFDAEYTYSQLSAASFTANFRRHYAVNINASEGGSIVVNMLGGNIANGDYVDAGTDITIKARPAMGQMLSSLKINDTERIADYTDAGISMTVNETVNIEAVFEAAQWPINITTTGAGTVVVALDVDTDTCEPTGEVFTQNITFADDTEFYVIARPAQGESVKYFEVDGEVFVGEDADSDFSDLYEHNGVYALYWVAVDTVEVVVEFTGEAAIDAVDADAMTGATWFNLQGIRVDADNLTPGIYILRTATRSAKVLVK